MNDTLQTLIRSVLKIGSGYFIAKGYVDSSKAEVISAGLIALVGVIWGIAHRTPGQSSTGGLSALFFVVGASSMLVGCSHFQKSVVTTDANGVVSTNQVVDLSRIAPAVKVAAFSGTSIALQEHPEWIKGFNEALGDLKLIEASPKIDFTTVLAVVQRLPVKELKSPEAKLAITGGTMLLAEYSPEINQITALDKVQEIRPIVTALREGVEQGLATISVP
jgi:hypothetical protein